MDELGVRRAAPTLFLDLDVVEVRLKLAVRFLDYLPDGFDT
ncbi:hypothetical protein ES703_33080 [subsurface metagenome]